MKLLREIIIPLRPELFVFVNCPRPLKKKNTRAIGTKEINTQIRFDFCFIFDIDNTKINKIS
jgi:hypothetical protein